MEMETIEFIPSEKDRGAYLTLPQYEVIVSFLNTRIKPSKDQLIYADLLLNLNGCKGKTTYYRFNSIVKRMTLRLSDGALLFKANMKVVLPCTQFVRVIKATHENNGGKHLTMTRTLLKLSEEYTIGCRQFGINEDLVRKVARSCIICQKTDKVLMDGMTVMKHFFSRTPEKQPQPVSNKTPIKLHTPTGSLTPTGCTTPTNPVPAHELPSSLPISLMKMLPDGTCRLIPIVPTCSYGPTNSGSLTNLCLDNMMRPVTFSSPQATPAKSATPKASEDKHVPVTSQTTKVNNVPSRTNKKILPKLSSLLSKSPLKGPSVDGANMVLIPASFVPGNAAALVTPEILPYNPFLFNAPGTYMLVESETNNTTNNSSPMVLSETSDHIIVDNLQQGLNNTPWIRPSNHSIVSPPIATAKTIPNQDSCIKHNFNNLTCSPTSTITDLCNSVTQAGADGIQSTVEEDAIVIDVESYGNHDDKVDNKSAEEPIIVDETNTPMPERLLTMPLDHSNLWYNQKDLEKEMVPFKRLTGCIQDLKLDVRRACAGSGQSAETIKKKINIIEQMINEQKQQTSTAARGAGIFGM